MMYEVLTQRLRDLAGERLRIMEPMARHTTFRVGGPADLHFSPRSGEEIRQALLWARELEVPVTVLGNGSNLVVSDLGIEGLVIQLGEDMACVCVEGTTLYAQAGAKLAAVARCAEQAGLTGLEFAHGIPGCVGGAVTMDAGAYGGEIGAVISCVEVLDHEGEIRRYCAEDMHFSYRHSRVMEEALIVLSASFTLTPGDRETIRAAMDDLAARRREKQPLEYPSAGSTFKRPAGYFAGKLIEDAGLKGLRVGDAQVSEKHAGFVVNRGQATAADIMALIGLVQEKVYADSGVQLEPEVRIIGRKA